MFKLTDSADFAYSPIDSLIEPALTESVELAPGQKTQGWIMFEIKEENAIKSVLLLDEEVRCTGVVRSGAAAVQQPGYSPAIKTASGPIRNSFYKTASPPDNSSRRIRTSISTHLNTSLQFRRQPAATAGISSSETSHSDQYPLCHRSGVIENFWNHQRRRSASARCRSFGKRREFNRPPLSALPLSVHLPSAVRA